MKALSHIAKKESFLLKAFRDFNALSRKEKAIRVISYSFVALWGYAALVKLSDPGRTHTEMMKQVFPHWMGEALVWLLPAAELFLVGLLLNPPTRSKGLFASFGLITLFSGYLALMVLNVFERRPCVCGGILSSMGPEAHLVFNLCFVALAVIAMVLTHKSRHRKGALPEAGRKEDAVTP